MRKEVHELRNECDIYKEMAAAHGHDVGPMEDVSKLQAEIRILKKDLDVARRER